MSSRPQNSDASPGAAMQILEDRLHRLEQRLDVELSLPSGMEGSSGRIRELAAAVHDLARQQQILRRDLESVFEALESHREGRGMETRSPPSATAPISSSLRDSLGRRAARWLLRNTLGRARAVWHSADPHLPPQLEISVGEAVPLPGPLRILGEAEALAGAGALSPGPQTVPPVPLTGGNRSPGSYRLLDAPSTAEGLLRTTWELLAWTLATETLAFLELRLTGGARILLAANAPTDKRPAVGKILSFPHGVPRRPLGPELTPAFRPSEHDRYCVARKGRPPRSHPLAPLLSPSPCQGQSRRLLLLDAPLGRSHAEWCAGRMRAHGGPESWLLVSRMRSDAAQSRRMQSFEALGALCYPLADFLEPKVSGSALEALTKLHSVASVTRLGEGPWPTVDLARWNDLELHNLDLQTPEDLPLAPEEQAPGPAPDSGSSLRAELGVGGEQILVVQTCDLERAQRPEDFLLLAHHLRTDERFFFFLCGEGAAEGTLADLESYLHLPRYRRRAALPRSELLAAADVVTSTAERLPLPFDLAAALAAGRPVVAAAAAGLERLPGALLVPVGDLQALTEALRRTATEMATPLRTSERPRASRATP